MVSVLMRQIPPFEEESQALATLIDGSEQINFIADRMQGGQMLLLPDDIMEKIVASLQKNASIHLFLNGYEATITSDHFCQSWRKLCRLPV